MHSGKLLIRVAKLVKRLNTGDVRFRVRRHHQLDKGCCIDQGNRKLLYATINYKVGSWTLCDVYGSNSTVGKCHVDDAV